MWRSTDGGATFTRISHWRAEPEESAHAEHHVIASPPNYDGKTVNTVYFSNDGTIYKTANGTAASPTWTQVDDGLPARYINRLTIADAAGRTVYVSQGGFAQQNAWRTTDAGATWVSRSGTGTSALPGAPVYSLVIHPSDVNTLYVGTDIGIFYSSDAGATWVRPSSGPATVSTDELIFLGTTLYAGTHGLGVYKSATP